MPVEFVQWEGQCCVSCWCWPARRAFEQQAHHRLSVRSAARLTTTKEMPLPATGASAAAHACHMLYGCHQSAVRARACPLRDSRCNVVGDSLACRRTCSGHVAHGGVPIALLAMHTDVHAIGRCDDFTHPFRYCQVGNVSLSKQNAYFITELPMRDDEEQERKQCVDLCYKDLTCAATMKFESNCYRFGQDSKKGWDVNEGDGSNLPAFCHAKPPGTCTATTMTYVGEGKCLDSADKSPPYHKAASVLTTPGCRAACVAIDGCVAYAEYTDSTGTQFQCTIYGTRNNTPACAGVAICWMYVCALLGRGRPARLCHVKRTQCLRVLLTHQCAM